MGVGRRLRQKERGCSASCGCGAAGASGLCGTVGASATSHHAAQHTNTRGSHGWCAKVLRRHRQGAGAGDRCSMAHAGGRPQGSDILCDLVVFCVMCRAISGFCVACGVHGLSVCPPHWMCAVPVHSNAPCYRLVFVVPLDGTWARFTGTVGMATDIRRSASSALRQ